MRRHSGARRRREPQMRNWASEVWSFGHSRNAELHARFFGLAFCCM
jgi:hypothetical protein